MSKGLREILEKLAYNNATYLGSKELVNKAISEIQGLMLSEEEMQRIIFEWLHKDWWRKHPKADFPKLNPRIRYKIVHAIFKAQKEKTK